MRFFIFVMVLTMAPPTISGATEVRGKLEPREDLEAPVVTHSVPEKVVPGRVVIKFEVYDASPLFAVVFHWRYVGEIHYRQEELVGRRGDYTARLDVTGPFEFWVEAFDERGNGPGLDGTDKQPRRVAVAPLPKPVDVSPPKIGFMPVPSSIRARDGKSCDTGRCIRLPVRITDESAVFGATFNWRNAGEKRWRQLNLSGGESQLVVVGPVYGDIQVWIEAYDEHGNGPAQAGSPVEPIVVKIGRIPSLDNAPAPTPSPSTPTAVPDEPAAEFNICKWLFFLPCCG